MDRSRLWGMLFAVMISFGAGTRAASGAPDFFGPTPYLGASDTPNGFYTGSPTALENFEDASLDFGITASAGVVLGSSAITDSVDEDDGTIDGSGTAGKSWFSSFGADGVTFTLPGLPTAAGIVWTDGAGTTSFEAFGPGMVSLGIIGPVAIADNFIGGQTDEDRFFGVQDAGGIVAIKLSNTSGGIEVDHVQFGPAGVADSDGDGIGDPQDNCTLVANPAQDDFNGDDIGDRCDADVEGPGGDDAEDCFVNFLDLQRVKDAFFANPASPQWDPEVDFDGSSLINFVDLQLVKDQIFGPPGPSANGCN